MSSLPRRKPVPAAGCGCVASEGMTTSPGSLPSSTPSPLLPFPISLSSRKTSNQYVERKKPARSICQPKKKNYSFSLRNEYTPAFLTFSCSDHSSFQMYYLASHANTKTIKYTSNTFCYQLLHVIKQKRI